MRSFHVAGMALFGLLAVAATPVFAATFDGFVTANVNERAGPSTNYPPITVIPAGSAITIYGCLSDDSWCDISWGPNRGWMSSLYLQASYQSRRVAIRDYSAIPFITFNFGSYWDSNYRNRPFFGQRSKWSNFNWQGQGYGNGGKPPKKYIQQNNNNQNYGQNDNNPNYGGRTGPNQKFEGGANYGNYAGGVNQDCAWQGGKLVCAPAHP